MQKSFGSDGNLEDFIMSFSSQFWVVIILEAIKSLKFSMSRMKDFLHFQCILHSMSGPFQLCNSDLKFVISDLKNSIFEQIWQKDKIEFNGRSV